MHVTTLGVVMAESAWLSGQCTRAESRAPALFVMRIELVVVRRCRGVRCSTSATLVYPQPVLRLQLRVVKKSERNLRVDVKLATILACEDDSRVTQNFRKF